MRKRVKMLLSVVLCIGLIVLFSSYDNKTMHKWLNEAVYDEFIKALSGKPDFANYQISTRQKIKGKAVTASGRKYINESDKEFTVKEWIRHGAYSADEPEWLQALRHFYDPLAIDNGAHYLTDAVPPGVTNPKVDIISWSLELEGEITHALTGLEGLPQNYSWRDGQKSIMLAMREPDADRQKRLMAHAWRCLGESLHGLADLVCPVHVRNDGHPYSDPYEDAIRGKKYILKNPAKFWDKGLVAKVKATKDVTAIYKMVAANTNENFFSTQTIYGDGVNPIKPAIRTSNPYPNPYARESGKGWDYDPSDFTYYKDINGHKIKMCKDRYYFADAMATNYRTEQAYVDLDVAESQSTVLLSNFMGVAPEVMTRFLPVIRIDVDKIKAGDMYISGVVDVTDGNGYPEKANFESTVYVSNQTTGKSVEAKAEKDGKFSTSDLEFEEGDKIQAYVSLSGLLVYGDRMIVDEKLDYPLIWVSGTVSAHKVHQFSGGWESKIPEGNLNGETVVCNYTFDRKATRQEIKTSGDGPFAGTYGFYVPCYGHGKNKPFEISITVRGITQKVIMDKSCSVGGNVLFDINVGG